MSVEVYHDPGSSRHKRRWIIKIEIPRHSFHIVIITRVMFWVLHVVILKCMTIGAILNPMQPINIVATVPVCIRIRVELILLLVRNITLHLMAFLRFLTCRSHIFFLGTYWRKNLGIA